MEESVTNWQINWWRGYFSAFYFPKVQLTHSHPIYFHVAKEIPSKVIYKWRYHPVFDKGQSSCTERKKTAGSRDLLRLAVFSCGTGCVICCDHMSLPVPLYQHTLLRVVFRDRFLIQETRLPLSWCIFPMQDFYGFILEANGHAIGNGLLWKSHNLQRVCSSILR